jgi:hypothetical protein
MTRPAIWKCQAAAAWTVRWAVAGKRWYFADTPSAASPDGFGEEETIRQIWASDR